MAANPDRLSALDAAFLDLETPLAPLTVGWTLLFAGRAPTPAALRRHLGARLDALPRLRRRLVEPALGLGDPHWVDDGGFDLARHVHAIRLAPPAGAEALRELAATLLAAPLDRRRPLWRTTLVEGLRPSGFALVGQAHHALVDGMAALELGTMLLDAPGASDATPTPGRWAPASPPSAVRVSADAIARRARTMTAFDEATARSALCDAALVAQRLAAPVRERSALERSASAARRIAFASVPLDDLRVAARHHGATVNDALLAAVAVAIGAALARRGEPVATARALVPASTRAADEPGASHANRISFLTVDLPLGARDPADALRLVRGRTNARKRSGESGAADVLLRAADALPPAARSRLTRVAARRARYTLVVSSLAGPREAPTLLGRELVAGWPAVPLTDGHALAIGALSLGGRLHVGLTADAALVPDVADIARDVERALDALRAAPEAVPVPWRARALTRRAQRGASRYTGPPSETA